MRDDHHAAAAIMERDRIEQRAQAQDDVAPTLSAGRAMIEFAEQAAKLRLLRMCRFDAETRETVEDSEFLLAQSLVDADALVGRTSARFAKDFGGLDCPDIGRGEHDVGATILFACCKPLA
jgi:hypothetical protein